MRDLRQQHTHERRGRGWLMIACCVPMLTIAAILVVTGLVSPLFIVPALACTAMMALMMRAMDDGDGHRM